MTIVAVDNDREQLLNLVGCLKSVFPEDNISGFTDPFLAVQYSFHQSVHMVFTEVRMKGMDGLTMTRGIRKNNPEVKAYCAAASREYIKQAKDNRMTGYLVKPITEENIRILCDKV